MNRLNRPVVWMVATVLAACLLYLGYNYLVGQTGGDDLNPYAYDLDDYTTVDPERIAYAEIAAIDLDPTNLNALAVGPQGGIFVAAGPKLLAFDRDGSPENEFQLEAPAYCIAVGAGDRLFLAMRDHVEVYSLDGRRLETWPGIGENGRLTSLALVGESLLAADYGNRVVWRFDMDGKLIGSIKGVRPGGKSGFIVPSPYFDVACGPDGSLWVVNPGTASVQEYSQDGELLRSWGQPSMAIEGFSGCCNPIHIAIMRDGRFVTAEKGLPRVKVYSPGGELDAVVAGPGHFGDAAGGCDGKALIQDVAVNAAGEVLVLDCKAGKIRIFSEKR